MADCQGYTLTAFGGPHAPSAHHTQKAYDAVIIKAAFCQPFGAAFGELVDALERGGDPRLLAVAARVR